MKAFFKNLLFYAKLKRNLPKTIVSCLVILFDLFLLASAPAQHHLGNPDWHMYLIGFGGVTAFLTPLAFMFAKYGKQAKEDGEK